MAFPANVKAFFQRAWVVAAAWCFAGILGGGLISWYISEIYYEKANSKALTEAVEQGRNEGRAEGHAVGVKEGLAAAKANEPKMIEERYPGAIQQARELGLAEGQKAGLAEGQKAGFEAGQKAGRDVAVKELSFQFYAERNWRAYVQRVSLVAASADRLDAQPGNDKLQRQLMFEAGSLVSAADALRAAYEEQGKAFNSIMDDLKAAVAAKDFQAMRVHARSLRATLETKGALFLQANSTVIRVFDDLSNPPKPQ